MRPVVSSSGNTRTRYFYNLDRQPTQILRPDGQTVDFGYDSAGRLSMISTPQGLTLYAYNEPGCNCSGVGNPSDMTAPGGVINYTYDGDWLTSAAWSGPVAGSVGRAYDANLRLVTLTVNGQDPLSFGNDHDSLLVVSVLRTHPGSAAGCRSRDVSSAGGCRLGGLPFVR